MMDTDSGSCHFYGTHGVALIECKVKLYLYMAIDVSIAFYPCVVGKEYVCFLEKKIKMSN